MTGYSQRVFPRGVLAQWASARDAVANLRSLPDSVQERIRCHELARAIARRRSIDAKVVDGKYGRVEHSWLLIHGSEYVLDVYCCGRLPQVQVIDMFCGLLHSTLYVEGDPRNDIDQMMVDLLWSHSIP